MDFFLGVVDTARFSTLFQEVNVYGSRRGAEFLLLRLVLVCGEKFGGGVGLED